MVDLRRSLAIALIATPAFAQQLTLHSPSSVIQCQQTLFTWDGGIPPYDLQLSSSSASSIQHEEWQVDATQQRITVDFPSGTVIKVALADGSGLTTSIVFTVQPND
ncbi:uncharacterized protein BXZ73DRAFT_45646, partial [Epithele typhae]|uniref:uncharacterized protein n=1 Tax=Epithele typhae TaxID=378194 RepID=UPI002007A9A9